MVDTTKSKSQEHYESIRDEFVAKRHNIKAKKAQDEKDDEDNSEYDDEAEEDTDDSETPSASSPVDPVQGVLTGDFINLDGNPFTKF